MANRYPDHSDDEAPRSRCSSRSDRESDSDADRARREQASDAARWSRGLLKTGDQRAAPSRGLPIITFTLILLMCAAFLQQRMRPTPVNAAHARLPAQGRAQSQVRGPRGRPPGGRRAWVLSVKAQRAKAWHVKLK